MDDTTSNYIYKGFMCKFTQEGDSIWMRDYNHFNNQYDVNFFYDAYPTSDNGYIAIGKARPDMGGSSNNMWIVKVDSMGCDTAGCDTGTFVVELSPSGGGWGEELKVWPNPANEMFNVQSSIFEDKGARVLNIYNSQGVKVEEIKIPAGKETVTVNVQGWESGIYYLRMTASGMNLGSGKVIVKK
jgi:hypothetical protein